MAWYCIQDKKLRLSVWARPNARSTGVREVTDTEIVVNINAPPTDNKANKELTGFVSKMLKIPKSSVKILAGATSTHKTVEVSAWEGSVESMQAAVKKMLE
ncbi:hypothetical protein EHEL_070320 [Encephalitozoon hellem ATCC 50504]|uniref:UPF0235 protein YggU n=1 Tax=Encephalitozoon hellem TaxID=27973 RepID=A0A9Q9CAD0_ENCHE|nr:uncharacterized protein EHEL_070320 [Encephalitozoon hellem ATCC 50504]AFM98559.1 hypothetical protein EHEL_070320 [Encephalitozoon hellem ATCC 50504]UTX43502.1 UPF0235 protein YggU [Encephalitozoon hellem]|eukprot:XP_003887540.1 hypothetical protein EHEL_070320 [Encephalitozoon hellem ATCC 50504]